MSSVDAKLARRLSALACVRLIERRAHAFVVFDRATLIRLFRGNPC